MTLAGAMAALQTHARGLSGMKDAPTTVPEGTGPFPFAVTYPKLGRVSRITDSSKIVHTVLTEIHCDRSLLGPAIVLATGFIEPFTNAILKDPTLGGAVATMQIGDDNPITYEFGKLVWGGIETIGIRFSVSFKIQVPLT